MIGETKYDAKEAAKREREKKRKRTDFKSLRRDMPPDERRHEGRNLTDLIIDVSIPFLIFLMVFSVVFFLLNVRYIYSAQEHPSMQMAAFCLIMGIVALNRLIARDNSGEGPMYFAGLAVVTGLFTVATTAGYDVGSFAGSFLDNTGWALFLNITIVCLLWWVTNRLVHECCVDENTSAGEVGILTGTLRNFRQAIQFEGPGGKPAAPAKKKSKSRHHELYRTTEIEAFDPTEWKPPTDGAGKTVEAPTKRLRKRHPGVSIFYFSVPVMAVFALGLPALMRGGDAFVLTGHVYVGIFTLCALTLLMLTSLGGIREYFRSRRVHLPPGIGPFWAGLGAFMVLVVAVGALQLPMPDMPAPAYVGEREFDAYTRVDRGFDLTPYTASAARQVQQGKIIQRVTYVVVAALVLFGVFGAIRSVGLAAGAIGKRRDLYPEWVVRLFNWLDHVLERIVSLPQVVPSIRYGYPRAVNARSTAFSNPMAGEGAAAKAEDIQRYLTSSFDALCALSDDMGAPRGKDQTPYEFLRNLPREMKPIWEEAAEVVELYVRSAYSPIQPEPKVLDRLRKFWLAYDQIRKRYIR